MTPKEFIEKYQDNPDVTLAFGSDYIVAYRADNYETIEKLPFESAGAIAFGLLQEMVMDTLSHNASEG